MGRTILKRSNKMRQYAGIYLLQHYSTYSSCSSHPSSGVYKTVTTASGTGHNTYLCNKFPPTWPKGCSYSFMYSWWWVRWTTETYRV